MPGWEDKIEDLRKKLQDLDSKTSQKSVGDGFLPHLDPSEDSTYWTDTFLLVLRNSNVTNVYGIHKCTFFSEQAISLENLCKSLCKGVLWFALLPLLWWILVLAVSYAKKTSPDTRVTFCPSQAKLSQTGGRKIKGFKTIFWPFCYLHLEPAWNLMCYSFIKAVTWAGVQLDKKSSGVKPPAQVWELQCAPPTQGCCSGAMNPSWAVITLQNSLSTG